MTQQKVTRPDDVIEIIKESLAQAKETRIPSAPPIWDTGNWEDSLRKCEALRKELETIRIRVKTAVGNQYGESSAFGKEADSFFVSNSTLNDLKEEKKRFIGLLIRILDDLRLSALPEREEATDTAIVLNQGDLFKQQFPAGLPFGSKKKPSLVLVPEHGSQRVSFEDELRLELSEKVSTPTSLS